MGKMIVGAGIFMAGIAVGFVLAIEPHEASKVNAPTRVTTARKRA